MKNMDGLGSVGSNLEKWEKILKESEEYLKKNPAKTLFPPNWEALKNGYCPLCGYKLYQSIKGDIHRCKSVRCPGFVIRDKRLKELSTPKNLTS